MRIRELLKEKQIIEAMIEKTVHGSIEIREGNDNKYIYLHFRDEGKLVTRYAGEYSNELYNVILENNIKVRQYKKHLRDIKKEAPGFSHLYIFSLFYTVFCFFIPVLYLIFPIINVISITRLSNKTIDAIDDANA